MTATLPPDHPCRTCHDPEWVARDNWARADRYRCRLCRDEILLPWGRAAAPMRRYDAHDSEDFYRADGEAEQREGRWK
jgi:hypothetical protein